MTERYTTPDDIAEAMTGFNELVRIAVEGVTEGPVAIANALDQALDARHPGMCECIRDLIIAGVVRVTTGIVTGHMNPLELVAAMMNGDVLATPKSDNPESMGYL